MVINNDPDWETKKRTQEKLNRTEDEIKDDVLAKFRQYSSSIICLAFMYATNFAEIGEDVTKKWETTQQQTKVLEAAYKKGFEDGIMKGREVEREQIKKNYDLVRHSNPLISNNNCFDFYDRTNTIPRTSGNMVQPSDAKRDREK